MYTFIYVEYGDSCDGFPEIANQSWDTKEDAFKAMEALAKINCWDTSYYYNIEGPGEKICIYEEADDDGLPSTIMALRVVEVPVKLIPAPSIDKEYVPVYVPISEPYFKPPFTITC